MWESLIAGVQKFLHAATNAYGDGDQWAGTPSLPEPPGPVSLPEPLSGVFFEALREEVDRHNDLLNRHGDTDAIVASLIAEVGQSRELSRKALAEQSAVFESSVAAVGPFAGSPFGFLALLLSAFGVVGTVTDGMTRDMGLMTNVAKQIPGQPGADPRETLAGQLLRQQSRGGPIYRASSYRPAGYQPSNPLSALERQRFRERMSRYSGSVPGLDLALALAGTPYVWGGFSPSGLDCSGAVAALVNYSLGFDPFDPGRTSTHTMAEWLLARGARPGLGGPGDLSIGFTNAGVGHTAATLPDGTNFESSGGVGVEVGVAALGADAPMFDQHWYIPGELLVGGTATVAV